MHMVHSGFGIPTGNFIRTNVKHSSGKHWQWDFPHQARTLQLHLRITSVSTLVGCGQFKPAQASLVQFSAHDKEWHSVPCSITSDLDFNKRGCVIQI